jgi:DNA-binding beta-propeller fold protein YncE
MARGSGLSFLATCDDPGDPTNPLPTQVGSVATPASLIRPLPDGKSLLALDPPNVSSVTSNLTALPGTPTPITANPPQVIGCPAPYTLSFPPPPPPSLPALGFLTNTTTTNFTADSGLGTFTPTAFLLSSDGQKAYILAANVLNVNVFDVASHTTTPLALTGNAAPIAGSLSSDGQTLYVTTSDNVLHIVNLVSGGDTAQLPLPSANLCALTTGGSVSSCKPDLLAVRP